MTDDKDAKLIEAGRKLFARDWQFIWASPSIQTLPPMDGLEIAFAGRSNVGKSSLINALTGRNALARTSHTPGRTQELIFFEVPRKERPAPRRHARLWLRQGTEEPGRVLDRADS
ncbi:ribosome biogenesis GTPase A [Bradyrhizobium diazoefficiens]